MVNDSDNVTEPFTTKVNISLEEEALSGKRKTKTKRIKMKVKATVKIKVYGDHSLCCFNRCYFR